jgi:copper chaperone CopZ
MEKAMKNNVYLTLILTILMLSMNFAYSATPKEISIQTNLHCESCAQKIEKGLSKVGGVINPKADVKSKVVTIKYDSDKTDGGKLTKAIADMGYKTEIIKNDECCTTDKKAKKTSVKKDCCDTKATKSAPSKK